MDDNNKAQLDLREMVRMCRSTLNDLNSNSLFAAFREQNKNFNNTLNLIEKYLPAAENVLNQDKADMGIKSATIFLIGLWSKLKQGESVSELTRDDWNSVMKAAAENAALMDPQEYSIMVFDLYKRSIAFAIEPMRVNASESVVNRLEEIVSLMEGYYESLEEGDISEVKFIEENLWLSLEAVFLVMTDRMNHMLIPEKRRELAEALSAFMFQRIRYSHYEEELAVINECLEYQAELDQRLTERINAYIDALNDELDEFDELVNVAFNTTDFQAAFRGSVQLSELVGADGVLHTKQDIDDFFLS